MENKHWLDVLLDEMKWTPADMARATKMDSAVISNIRNGKREIGLDTAIAIGKATKRKPETILRMAGKLPPEPDVDEWVDKIDYKIKLIPPGLRSIAESFIDSMLVGEEAEPVKPAKPRSKTSTGKA